MNNPLSKIIEEQKKESELAVFWEEIASNLPKSREMSALGHEKVFLAFKSAYPKIKGLIYLQFLRGFLTEIGEEDKNAKVTSDYYSGTIQERQRLRKVVEGAINNLTKE